MRIAMLTNNYKPFVGGVPISIERLSTELRALGHEVTIYAPYYEEAPPEEGVVRYKAMQKRHRSGYAIPSLFDPSIEKDFKERSFDIIHVHHPMVIGYTALYLSSKYKIPMVFTYHTRYEKYLHHIKLYEIMEKHAKPGGADFLSACCRAARKVVPVHNAAFMKHCDVVFAPTPLMRDYLREMGNTVPVVILPTGLANEDFVWDEGRAASLRQRYAPNGEFLFCSVARLEREKNISFLLRSLAVLKQSLDPDHDPGFRFIQIGEGTIADELAAEVKQLGLEDNVEFIGAVAHSELSGYYAASDLFLFASKSETQGIVLLEGMAARLPVVAVDASGVCDVVNDGYNGYKTPEDECVFAERVRGLISDAPLMEKLRAGAVQTAGSYRAGKMAVFAETCYYRAIENRKADASGSKEHKDAVTRI